MQKEYKSYLNFLKQQDPVKYGNHIWLKDGYIPKKEYQNDVFNYLNGNIENLQFSNPAAADTVNNWVSNITNGKINKECYFTNTCTTRNLKSKKTFFLTTYLSICEIIFYIAG